MQTMIIKVNTFHGELKLLKIKIFLLPEISGGSSFGSTSGGSIVNGGYDSNASDAHNDAQEKFSLSSLIGSQQGHADEAPNQDYLPPLH